MAFGRATFAVVLGLVDLGRNRQAKRIGQYKLLLAIAQAKGWGKSFQSPPA